VTTDGLIGLVFINLALIIYTIGVWSERFQGRLKWWHVGMFYTGLVCDTIGTGAMGLMAGWYSIQLPWNNRFSCNTDYALACRLGYFSFN